MLLHPMLVVRLSAGAGAGKHEGICLDKAARGVRSWIFRTRMGRCTEREELKNSLLYALIEQTFKGRGSRI